MLAVCLCYVVVCVLRVLFYLFNVWDTGIAMLKPTYGVVKFGQSKVDYVVILP